MRTGLTIFVLAGLIVLGLYVQHQYYSNSNHAPDAIGSSSPERDKYDVTSHERRRTLDLDIVRVAGLGDTNRVGHLLDLGADLNARDDYGDTPLITAAAHGHMEVVNVLLGRGAEVNAKNGMGNTALIDAASINHVEIVKALLTKGADLNAKNDANLTALDAARREKHQAAAELLSSGMIQAADKTNYLVPNVKIEADLNRAAKEGNVEQIRSMLARGADINAIGEGGRTPLVHAVFHDNIAAVRYLLANNANPNATDSLGRTALIVGIMRGRADIVQVLLNSRADPNVKDKSGNTPMSLVRESRQVYIGRLLKQAGAKTPAYTQVLSPP